MTEARRAFLERLHGKLVRTAPAEPDEEEADDDPGRDAYLHVQIGSEHLALPVDAVEEVVVGPSVTPVPRAPNVVRGVFVHRGTLVPVVDTGLFTGTKCEASALERIVVVGQGEDAIGLVVTATLGVIYVDEQSWRELPRETWRYVTRATRLSEHLIGLLDVPQILAMEVVADGGTGEEAT